MATVEGFTASEVLRLVPGLRYATMNYWIVSGMLQSSARPANGKGTRRRFTLADVIAVRVVQELRNGGVSLQGLRKVAKQIQRSRRKATHPLASTSLVIVPGDKPDVAQVFVTDDAMGKLESLLQQPGQRLMRPVVLPLEPLALQVRGRLVELERERANRAARRHARERELNLAAVRRYRAKGRAGEQRAVP